MAKAPKEIVVRPRDGGRLMADISLDDVGFANYAVKRDWRRDREVEMRSEGYTGFRPSVDVELGNQPWPGGPSLNAPITLIAMAGRKNGKTAVVVGTQTTLWVFYALENGDYFEDQAYYFDSTDALYPYVLDATVEWVQIGGGFSASGKRWQARQVGGKLILNNQVDLPVSYTVGDREVKPLYELREVGVGSVGCIMESHDVLLLGDVSVIRADTLATLRSPVDSGAITASQSGAQYSGLVTATSTGRLVTASGDIFTGDMVGSTIIMADGTEHEITEVTSNTTAVVAEEYERADGLPFWVSAGAADYVVTASADIFEAAHLGMKIYWDSGELRTIKEVISATQVRVGIFVAVPAGEFAIENPATYQAFTDATLVDRYQSRILHSGVEQPERFGWTGSGTAAAGNVILTLQYPTKALATGDEIIILGAGVDEGNLTTTINYLSEDGRTIILTDHVVTAVADVEVALNELVGSPAGSYYDLEDDVYNGAILGGETLEDKLAVFKDGSIFLGFYTGKAAALFSFRRQWTGDKGLAYPHTLAKISMGRTELLMYAGRQAFYFFDLASLVPNEVPLLEFCRGVFFENADRTRMEEIFACNNAVTQEVLFVAPTDGDDKVLRYNYQNNSISTSSAEMTAGATVNRPVVGIEYGASEHWFVMGTAAGKVLRYGLVSGDVLKVGTAVASGTGVVVERALLGKQHIGRTLAIKSYGGRWVCSEIVGVESQLRLTVADDLSNANGECRILPGLWHRDGAEYDSVLVSGLDDFGAKSNETKLHAMSVTFASDSFNNPVSIAMLEAPTPGELEDLTVLAEVAQMHPKSANRVRILSRGRHWAQRVTVSGKNNPLALVNRGVELSAIGSRGINVTKT